MAQGTIYEASGSFYVRYVTGMTVSKNGENRPVQKSHRLCEKNDKFYFTRKGKLKIFCKAVQLLAQEFMLSINKRESAVGEDMPIAVFWEQRYVPYCEEVVVGGRPRKKPSTVRGYRQIWAQT